MVTLTVDFLNLLLAALLVGAMFAVCLIFNPRGLDAATYVSLQQHAIRVLQRNPGESRGGDIKMPLLGAITAMTTFVAAVLARSERVHLTLLLVAAGLFVVAGLVTRFLNQPINAVVRTWSAQAPPANWMQLRDAWWRWHLVRFSAGLGGLCLLILAAVRSRG
jgi:uncharacterized membrane protein